MTDAHVPRTLHERVLGVLRAHGLLLTVPGQDTRLADKIVAVLDEGPCDALSPLFLRDENAAPPGCELRYGHASPWHEATNADGVTKYRWYQVPTTGPDLDALQALADAATPGPWWTHDTANDQVWCGDQAAIRAYDASPTDDELPPCSVIATADSEIESLERDANAAFIAAARAAIPALIADLRARARRDNTEPTVPAAGELPAP